MKVKRSTQSFFAKSGILSPNCYIAQNKRGFRFFDRHTFLVRRA